MICSNGLVQFGPAAWGGYFFGATIKPKRDPSLTHPSTRKSGVSWGPRLFPRDDDPDRIVVFSKRPRVVITQPPGKDFARAAKLRMPVMFAATIPARNCQHPYARSAAARATKPAEGARPFASVTHILPRRSNMLLRCPDATRSRDFGMWDSGPVSEIPTYRAHPEALGFSRITPVVLARP
jgi:hypothetical protein